MSEVKTRIFLSENSPDHRNDPMKPGAWITPASPDGLTKKQVEIVMCLLAFYVRPTAYSSSEWNLWHGLVCRVLVEPPAAIRHRSRFGQRSARMLDRANAAVLRLYLQKHQRLGRRVHVTRAVAAAWLKKFPGARRSEYARRVCAGHAGVGVTPHVKCEATAPGKKVRIIQGFDRYTMDAQAYSGPVVEELTRRMHEEHPPGSPIVPCGGFNGEEVGLHTEHAINHVVSSLTLGLVRAAIEHIPNLRTVCGLQDDNALATYEVMRDYLALAPRDKRRFHTDEFQELVLGPQAAQIAVAIAEDPRIFFFELDVDKMDTSVRSSTRQVLSRLYRRAGMPRRGVHVLHKLRTIHGREGKIKYFAPYGNVSGASDTYLLNLILNVANLDFALSVSQERGVTTLVSGDDAFGVGGRGVANYLAAYPRTGMSVTTKVTGSIFECTFLGSWFLPSEVGYLPTPLLGRCLFKAAMSRDRHLPADVLAGRWALTLAHTASHDPVLGRYLRTVARQGRTPVSKYKLRNAGVHTPTYEGVACHLLRYGVVWRRGLHPFVERAILLKDGIIRPDFPATPWETQWLCTNTPGVDRSIYPRTNMPSYG